MQLQFVNLENCEYLCVVEAGFPSKRETNLLKVHKKTKQDKCEIGGFYQAVR